MMFMGLSMSFHTSPTGGNPARALSTCKPSPLSLLLSGVRRMDTHQPGLEVLGRVASYSRFLGCLGGGQAHVSPLMTPTSKYPSTVGSICGTNLVVY